MNGPILLLTQNENTNDLFDWLRSTKYGAIKLDRPITSKYISEVCPSFVLSFNYGPIISSDVIELMKGSIANVHTSLLPYNKGVKPNFFSFYYNTPKGVTIHEVTSRLDAGRIIFQKELFLTDEESFSSSYERLLKEAVSMIKENLDNLINKEYSPKPQLPGGSYHTTAEFEELKKLYPFEWEDNISMWKSKYSLK